MSNSFAFYVFSYWVPRSEKQFFYWKEQAFVKMENGMREIVTEDMLHRKTMDFSWLTAVNTKIPLKFSIAV
jgi:hypothetical protein